MAHWGCRFVLLLVWCCCFGCRGTGIFPALRFTRAIRLSFLSDMLLRFLSSAFWRRSLRFHYCIFFLDGDAKPGENDALSIVSRWALANPPSLPHHRQFLPKSCPGCTCPC